MDDNKGYWRDKKRLRQSLRSKVAVLTWHMFGGDGGMLEEEVSLKGFRDKETTGDKGSTKIREYWE